MNCCRHIEEKKRQREQSKKIDREMQKDKWVYRSTYRILLLGTGESGKSTLLKQMRILHDETPLNEAERKQIKDEIRQNVKNSITIILQAMTTIDPPVACADTDLEDR